MAEKNKAVEAYPGEVDRNADFIKFSRGVIQTGKIPVPFAAEGIEATRDTLEMLEKRARVDHARQVELAKSGIKPKEVKNKTA